MFIRLFRYHLLESLRKKEIMFWSFLFPFILGTLFYLVFGNYMNNREIFQTIPIAYVEEGTSEQYFVDFLTNLQQEEKPLVQVKTREKIEAESLLKEGEITGIFLESNGGISLIVNEEGINESILKLILEEYERKQSAITSIAEKNPGQLSQALAGMEQTESFLKEEKTTDKNMDAMINFFYALMAMSCLYGSFMGVDCALQYKANLSPLGARRMVAGTNRFLILSAELSARILLQFLCSLLAFAYLVVLLKVDFGRETARMVAVIGVGTIVGVMTGAFIGLLGKGREQIKLPISISVTMLECFLSGLMLEGVYYSIERTIPLLNRINPAALIVNAFYSLNIYDTYERYTQNVLSLLVIALLLGIGSYLAVRRERYASI